MFHVKLPQSLYPASHSSIVADSPCVSRFSALTNFAAANRLNDFSPKVRLSLVFHVKPLDRLFRTLRPARLLINLMGLLYGAAYGQLFSNEMKFNFAGESRAIAANMYISPAWVSVRSTGRVEGDAVIEDSQNQPGLLQWVDHHPAQ